MDNQYEDDLKRAFEAFQNVKRTEIFERSRGTKGTVGSTFWDFAREHAHPELEDTIAYLARNADRMDFQELLKKHLAVVTYFERIGHLRAPGGRQFDAKYLRDMLALYHRDEERLVLEAKKRSESDGRRKLAEARKKVDMLFQILEHHLYSDRESIVDGRVRDKLIDSSDVQMEAYRIYMAYTSGAKNASQLPELSESSFQTALALPPSHGITSRSLDAVRLRDRVVAHLACTLFLNHFDREIGEHDTAIASCDKRIAEVVLSRAEGEKLRLFRENKDPLYSPESYFAVYTNAAWATVKDFFADLHRRGIPVVININI